MVVDPMAATVPSELSTESGVNDVNTIDKTVALLAARRSSSRLTEPGPSDEELRQILDVAAAAPDHGDLKPFRFVVLRDEARVAFTTHLIEALEHREAAAGRTPTPGQISKEQGKLLRAPVVVVVAAIIDRTSRIPEIEQILSAGSAAYGALMAAHLLGFGAIWRTGEMAYDSLVAERLGLPEGASIVGWLYFGTPRSDEIQESKGDSEPLTTVWEPSAT